MLQKFANDTLKLKKDNTPMTKTCVRKEGTVNSKFIKAHNITSCIHPYELIALFLTLNGNPYSTAKKNTPKLSTA